jgi:hypothetical protein
MVMAVIGENTKMARGKDMEHMIMIVERDTSGNGCKMTCTGMEYTDTQTDQYIMDNRYRIKEKAMDISEMQKTENHMDS